MGKRSSRLRNAATDGGIKVAFDEHVPPAIAKVFIALAKENPIRRVSKGIVWERAVDYVASKRPKGTRRNDVPWLDNFAAAGGRAIISGHVNMRRKPHERSAKCGQQIRRTGSVLLCGHPA